MADTNGVLILAEATEGKLNSTAAELLAVGRKLADALGQDLAAVVIGKDVAGQAPEAIALGANKVYVVDDPLLENYQTESYLAAIDKAVAQAQPGIILMGQTSIGRDLAPRLAFHLDTVCTLDCIALEIDPDSKRLLQTKPVYGGSAQAVYTTDSDPQIVTVRAKSVDPAVADSARTGEVINVDAGLDASAIRTSVQEKVKEEVVGIKLEDASIIISGGRGIGDSEGFKQLEELATVLKGTVGASRPACDAGWISEQKQVGLTGKMVTPDVYVAIGISGASQHLAGCSGAKTIVAINKDPEANIFREARYGVVGDWKKILPAFTAKVKELVSG